MSQRAGFITQGEGLRSRPWLFSYKTSSTVIEGRTLDILHDFYIPALQLSQRYDRVAGYFRSSSLAAASQGFSTFINRGGRMRLVVGADIHPEDARAIIAGDSKRMTQKLDDELGDPSAWPEGVRNGVTLLAWMIAHGHLEVRVAFRVHARTKEPLPFDSTEDGYVHEKWFNMQDEYGNRLYGVGSLNESRRGLELNAENIEVHCDWWNEIERQRVDQATGAFEALWQNKSPSLVVLTLPEAVRKRLVRFAEGVERPLEIDGTTAAPEVVEKPSAIERLQFAVIRDAPKMPGGRFVGLETAPVEPWPHQGIVVRRLVETWPYSYLLCDEVGLGKTIEAGLAIRCLHLAGLAKRVLIAAPASLTDQWLREMASKMLLPFGLAAASPTCRHLYLLPEEEERASDSLFGPDLIILSTGLLAREERARELGGASAFDIVLVDEAHAARRRNPTRGTEGHPDYGNLYTSIRDCVRPKALSLWLATATPMQIHPVEVCDLLALTNRVGAFQYDPTLTLQYYEVLGKLVHGQPLEDYESDFLRHAVRAVQREDPMLWRFLESSVIDGGSRVVLQWWLDHEDPPSLSDYDAISRLAFSASPLGRVMLRHTRQLLEIYREKGQLKQNLARREILRMPDITFNSQEERIYHHLEEYCRGLASQLGGVSENSRNRQMVSFLLSFLRLRFASSLHALRETLRRRLEKVEATLRHDFAAQLEPEDTLRMREMVFESDEDEDVFDVDSLLKNRTQEDLEWERARLEEMLEEMVDLTGPSSKMTELLRRLESRRDRTTGRIQQTVIFTRFYDTLTDIVLRLRRRQPGMLVGTYSGRGGEYFDPRSGRMEVVDREEVKARFLRGEIDVLVCTDAAAEGLNLQTADLLVNFDLGWNPMKIEQRIGRIDRIGQKHDKVYVLNLCYVDSAEALVYGRLLSRLEAANLIVGTQQISLLPVEPEEFQELAERTLSFEELEKRARKRLVEQRQRMQKMEIDPADLYEIYARVVRDGTQEAPLNLSSIWEALSGSRYLKRLGCVTSFEDGEQLIRLSGVDGVADGTLLTTSRSLYEKGLTRGRKRLHFASYGDPCFDALIHHMQQFELPRCVRRLTTHSHGVERVAYAVACQGPDEAYEVRMVTSWKDLDGLALREDVSLSESEVAPLREKLGQMAHEELTVRLTADRVRRTNIRAGLAQELLSALVIRDLLYEKSRMGSDGAAYAAVLREVESLFEDRPYIRLPDLPADLLSPLREYLLFNCSILTGSNKAFVRASRILGRCGIDKVRRLVDGMKVRKSDLPVQTVLSRLERNIEESRRALARLARTL